MHDDTRWVQSRIMAPDTVQVDLRIGLDLDTPEWTIWIEASVPSTKELLAKQTIVARRYESPFHLADAARQALEAILGDVAEPF